MDGGSFSKFGREILWWTKPCASRETAKTFWVIGGHLQHFYNLPPGNGCFNSMYTVNYSHIIFALYKYSMIQYLQIPSWLLSDKVNQILFLQSPNVSASRALRAWTGREPEKSSQKIVKSGELCPIETWISEFTWISLNLKFSLFSFVWSFPLECPFPSIRQVQQRFRGLGAQLLQQQLPCNQQEPEQNHTKWRYQC